MRTKPKRNDAMWSGLDFRDQSARARAREAAMPVFPLDPLPTTGEVWAWVRGFNVGRAAGEAGKGGTMSVEPGRGRLNSRRGSAGCGISEANAREAV